MKTKTTQGARRLPGLRTLTPRRFQNDNWELKVPFEINPVCGPGIGSCGARTQLLGKQGLVLSPRESAGRSQQNKAWGCNVSAAPSPLCTPPGAQHSAIQSLLASGVDSFMFLGCFQSMLSSQIQKKYTKLSPKAENGGLAFLS